MKKMSGFVLGAIIVIGLALAFTYLRPAGNTGTLIMQITDAPSDLNISKVLITVSQVQVHKADAGEQNETNENKTTKESSWFTVVSGSQTYDLIAIKDVKTFLGSKELEAGKYTQVRLSIDKALVTIDGVEYNLVVPSEKLKLIKGFTLVANQTTTLTLDFNAQESIKQEDGKNEYKLRPTVKIIQE